VRSYLGIREFFRHFDKLDCFLQLQKIEEIVEVYRSSYWPG